MPQLTLTQAQVIVATALKHGSDQKMQPLAGGNRDVDRCRGGGKLRSQTA